MWSFNTLNADIEANPRPNRNENEFDIAIVGMSCRFPGAHNPAAFWENLAKGIESIARLSDEQMLRAGVPARFLSDPNFVKAAPILEGPGLFDAAFFGFSPTEAQTMDPQHRILLELAHEALEDAACDPARYPGRIGVFTGSAMNTYFMNSGLPSRFAEDYIPTLIVNDKDFLSTRISYKLNLKGPSITIQTACSTSLVAVHLARQSLLSEESDIALAGAVSVRVPHESGYFCDGGGVVSPDGHVRAFDAKANGTVFGSGGGIIVLKRLADAIANRDTIHAVIKGSAVNNDGSEKAGYTAPSVNSQADAIVEALANAGVEGDTISYIEAHGSGTPLGDSIELTALTKAFRTFTQRSGYCAVGSVKTNVGHLDAAAGIAGIIKTVLALKHRQLPASLHYTAPNPEISFAQTPFYVNTQLAPWDGEGSRRAGVMSTGMGGTNAHVVLEEAPNSADLVCPDLPQLLVLSAKSETALDAAATRLLEFLKNDAAVEIADVVYTLQAGRKAFPHRRAVVCASREDAIATLSEEKSKRITSSHVDESSQPQVLFLLPGIGDHYVGMALDLYEKWDAFREEVDHCALLLEPHLGIDIRKVIYPNGSRGKEASKSKGIDLKAMLGRKGDAPEDPATDKLNQTIYAQPALFTIEYALARLWQHLGITPDAIVCHSMGEYVAACLSGVFSLEDGLGLIARRAKLANELSQGAMLAVLLTETELLPLLNRELSIALINGPNLCVVAGPVASVTEFEKSLNKNGIISRPVRNAHAFHSRMLDPIVPAFVEEVRKVQLHEPRIPFTSNVTGNWITKEEATDPEYWARHASQTARFSDALHQLWQIKNAVLLEVGPGKTLSVLAAQHPDSRNVGNPKTVSSLRHHYENESDIEFFWQSVSRMWLTGIEIDWEKLPEAGQRRRIPLPTYPFERDNYWLKTVSASDSVQPKEVSIHKNPDLSKWFYVPSWKRTLPKAIGVCELAQSEKKRQPWLVFSNDNGFTSQVIDRLKASGRRVVTVNAGDAYQQIDPNSFVLTPSNSHHYDSLVQALRAHGNVPGHVIHAWALTGSGSHNNSFQRAQGLGFYSLLFLIRALAAQKCSNDLDLFVLSNDLQEIYGSEALSPEKATLLGPCMVIPQEYPNIRTKSIDLEMRNGTEVSALAIDQIIGEFFSSNSESFVAYRNFQRWVQTYEKVGLDRADKNHSVLRRGGAYLITGGLGNIGHEVSKYLTKNYNARLLLVGRCRLPERHSWDSWIANHQPDDPVSDKIRKIVDIEKLGGEVLYVDAAVDNLEDMRGAIDQAVARFGALHGVIHAAGVTGERRYREVVTVDCDHGDAHFQVKAHALLALEELLRDKPLDFVLLVSSLTSVLGGIGHAAYASSCIFMDSLARKHNRSGATPWLSVNWDFWRVEDRAVVDSGTGRTIQDLGMSANEALEVMETVLPMRHAGQLLISTGDLGARLDQWIRLESLHREGEEGGENSNRTTLAQRPSLQTRYDSPRDDTENRVAEIWQRALGINSVGINDNFSDLGGHSLLAIKIISELRRAFEIDLPIKALFEAPTVAELSIVIRNRGVESYSVHPANEIDNKQKSHERPNELLDWVRKESPELLAEDAFFLPRWFIQQTSWLIDPSNSDSAVYNYALLLRIRGRLNETALRQSLQEIVRRHEVFRSAFRIKDGELVQVIVPPRRQDLCVTDLSDLPETDREARANGLALERASDRFDLARGSLLRTELIRLAAEDHILQLTTHHIIYDDWSTAVISRDLSELYQTFATGKGSPLAEIEFQYGDFVRWQQGQLQGKALETKLSYWKRQMTSSTPFYHLTTDFARPKISTKHGARERIILPPDLTESLKVLRRKERVSLFMLLLAGFKCLLHHFSNHEEIGVGSCGANRPFEEAEGLVGRFGNAMLLRTSFSGNPTFRELLKRVRATALGAYSDQDLPFGQLVGELANGAQPTRPPFQAMFILQNAPQDDPQVPGLSMNWSPLYNETAKYDLDVWLKAEPEMEIILEYRTDLFRAETMKQILADYCAVLEAIVKDPGMSVSDLLPSRNPKPSRNETTSITAKEMGSANDATRPKDEVEGRLLGLWETAFRIRPIAVDQDFFELGGDSLLAARLFPQIEKAFKINLPLAALLEAPTVRQLANRIGGHKIDLSDSCLVPIQTGGKKKPLFCVHGHMGEVFYCRNLSDALGSDQPLYGLRSYGLGDKPPHQTIEEMAVHNLKEIRKVQPMGPYFLSGYCLGGMVAYEMARLLDLEGVMTSLLVLFNTPAPGSFKNWPFGRVYLTNRITHELKKLRKLGMRDKLVIFGKKAAELASLAFGRLKTAVARSFSGEAKEAAQQWLSVADINISAAKSYAPGAYAGHINLFLTEEASSLYSIDPKDGWKALAKGGVEVHGVSGDNNSMFDARYVDALGEKLKACIEKAGDMSQSEIYSDPHLQYGA